MEQTLTKNTFRKYSEYKDSGVDWLGEVPEGWEILPGLSFILEGKDKNKGMKRNTILSLSYGNIRIKGEDELTGLVPESFETYQLVNKGDLIFRPTDLQNDKVSLRSSISNYEGIITSAYLNLRFKTKAFPKFYHYLFRAIDNNKVIYGLGSGLRQNISYLDFRRLLFPFPKKAEQIAIANFLDKKTTKIDQAIAQKEKMITLLKERKQIIIQNAVTKGLDPNVKMKDSGVEWIGEIPEHWEVKRLGNITKVIDPQPDHRAPKIDENGLPYIGIRDINDNGSLNVNTARMVEIKAVVKQEKAFKLEDGDLLYGKVGTLGNPKRLKLAGQRVALSATLVIVKTPKEELSRYLKFALDSQLLYSQIETIITGATRPALGIQQIRKFIIVVPPLCDLKMFNEMLESRISIVDNSISLQQTQIEKLKEYKATMIDSAVTGKIKVTDYGK